MSLQGLISGSECAVPSNPLAQVLKHTEGDRSLQQVRILQPIPCNQTLNRFASGSGRRTFIVSGATVFSSAPVIFTLKGSYSCNISRAVRQPKLQNKMSKWQGNFSEGRWLRRLHLLQWRPQVPTPSFPAYLGPVKGSIPVKRGPEEHHNNNWCLATT